MSKDFLGREPGKNELSGPDRREQIVAGFIDAPGGTFRYRGKRYRVGPFLGDYQFGLEILDEKGESTGHQVPSQDLREWALEMQDIGLENNLGFK